MKKTSLTFLFILFIAIGKYSSQTGWNTVSSFGTNPGNLNMYSYAPTALPANAPLVIVLHGCTQTATQYATESGWNTLADQHSFYTVFPEQNTANNSSRCFNWYNYADQNKGQGEAFSIKQMVDYMTSHYNIDASRIYVTGLSAGACMTSIMLACYPEVISKGAIMAGTAFKSSTNAFTASNAMNGFVTHSAVAWGDSVRKQNPLYTGAFPKVALFQGVNDPVVNANNVTEIIKQWTNIHATDQTYDSVDYSFNGNGFVSQYIYNNAASKPVVYAYMVSGMGHAISIDPGNCYQKGGTSGTYALDYDFYSSFWAADFFDILKPPYSIAGSINVTPSSTGNIYSVPFHVSSTYSWTAPATATIISGQGTNSITVNFGSTSGTIYLTETDVNGCKIGPVKLLINVITTTFIHNTEIIELTPNTSFNKITNSIEIFNTNAQPIDYMRLLTIDGKQLNYWNAETTLYKIDRSLETGIYLIEYSIKKQPHHQKIIIN